MPLDQDANYLIVDDDGVCRAVMAAMLSSYGQCHFATDGQQAVAAVSKALDHGCPYDLICLDLVMPGFSGHDTLSAIRQIESQHGIYGSDGAKVIMTTSLYDSKHCIQSFREGCESYLTKPIRQTELLDMLRRLELIGVAAGDCPASGR